MWTISPSSGRSGAGTNSVTPDAPGPDPRPLDASPRARVLPHLLEHEHAGLAGPFLPREDARGHRAVESETAQRAEEVGPVDLALTDVEVLVDRGGGPGRVDDVPVPRG